MAGAVVVVVESSEWIGGGRKGKRRIKGAS